MASVSIVTKIYNKLFIPFTPIFTMFVLHAHVCKISRNLAFLANHLPTMMFFSELDSTYVSNLHGKASEGIPYLPWSSRGAKYSGHWKDQLQLRDSY